MYYFIQLLYSSVDNQQQKMRRKQSRCRPQLPEGCRCGGCNAYPEAWRRRVKCRRERRLRAVIGHQALQRCGNLDGPVASRSWAAAAAEGKERAPGHGCRAGDVLSDWLTDCLSWLIVCQLVDQPCCYAVADGASGGAQVALVRRRYYFIFLVIALALALVLTLTLALKSKKTWLCVTHSLCFAGTLFIFSLSISVNAVAATLAPKDFFIFFFFPKKKFQPLHLSTWCLKSGSIHGPLGCLYTIVLIVLKLFYYILILLWSLLPWLAPALATITAESQQHQGPAGQSQQAIADYLISSPSPVLLLNNSKPQYPTCG